jgi:hypothetical protein
MAAYYGIIPATVRYDKELTANAKLLYSEFTALSQEKGYCFASNSYFAELYGVSKETISRWISLLSNKNYIRIEYTYKNGTKEIDKRLIYINDVPIIETQNKVLTKSSIPPCENNQYPLDENVKGNITRVNNTSLKKENTKEKSAASGKQSADPSAVVLSIKEAADKVYAAYPCKKGKAKGYEYLIAYLGKGRKVTGLGNVRFNHEELFCAVRQYSIECDDKGTGADFIKHFSTFMNKDVIDYVEAAKEIGYEKYMFTHYGENWRNVRFIYTE